jgi:hypothetical protein
VSGVRPSSVRRGHEGRLTGSIGHLIEGQLHSRLIGLRSKHVRRLVFLVVFFGAMALPRPLFAARPAISIHDATITEGRAGIHRVVVKVRLSAPTARRISARYRTMPAKRGGKAAAGADYLSRRGMLRIGRHRQTGRIVVYVRGDRLHEATERPSISFFHDNFVENPLFVNFLLRDYHLQPGSPARGRGVAEWTPATNIEGEPRSIPPDLGAY